MKGRIEKRAPGVYKLIVEMGEDAMGRRHRRCFTVHGTLRQAEKELAKIVREIDTGAFCDAARISVGEYLDRWLEDYGRHKLAARSLERYQSIVTQHMRPAIGCITLGKLRPAHIQNLYGVWLTEGLSPSTVQKHHAVLHAALDSAVRLQMLPSNPTDAVDVPKARRREMQALDELQTAELLQAAKGKPLYAPVFVAVSTGLRRGELLGLRWQDVDLDAGALSVVRTIEEVGGQITFKDPKTPKSRRRVSLGPSVIEVLRQLHKEHAETRLLCGSGYNPDGLVFVDADGAPWRPLRLTDSFGRLAKRAGFPRLRLHDLRHTHATQLLRAGVHVKVVSERLGHANISTTLDTYSHVLPGMQEDAVALHDAVLARALETVSGTEKTTLGTKMAPTAPILH